ncbi:hypothetical protein QR98_0095190 [Sarcoptes scabiei]|uniref:TdIF1 C-terminal domain-containing protein n=1 Tax=Sarcoptes scabiei TaxID=52283 RepID=A0A132AIZ4_SARSC|nr:hypothetical protein QR98_0095190 [Sarcoptes scabiei]
MHRILEEAKKLYPLANEDQFLKQLIDDDCRYSEELMNGKSSTIQRNFTINRNNRTRPSVKYNRGAIKSKSKRKRKESSFQDNSNRNRNRNLKSNQSNFNRIECDDSKWDPSRLTTETLFVLGSKANKALGFGSTRGRLYSKHSELFRYIGDHEDKEWLHKNRLMPPTGGKAYLLVKDDIIDLINSNEYRDVPGVNVEDMGAGFTVPQLMIDKIIESMRSLRKIRSKNRKSTKDSEMIEQLQYDDGEFDNSILEDSDVTKTTNNHNNSIIHDGLNSKLISRVKLQMKRIEFDIGAK